ncbi:hypothetical protein BpHYR1_028689 [Brachionus plicatilis]|uniref:Uncharacterized protein n=1 Tax=Brachionus plicatilis TaxID=10195 RepID=A0A3M7PR40_BRAPC|nr:hypothetical protein BpHYR1_028689 [Brachionus plicatilis]
MITGECVFEKYSYPIFCFKKEPNKFKLIYRFYFVCNYLEFHNVVLKNLRLFCKELFWAIYFEIEKKEILKFETHTGLTEILGFNSLSEFLVMIYGCKVETGSKLISNYLALIFHLIISGFLKRKRPEIIIFNIY